jgi:SAM-dependent methyltransferase
MQIKEFESPAKIFSSGYAYFSSYSDTWLKHCRIYSHSVTKRFGLNKRSLIIEIASNDGYLLQFFKEKNIPVLGIEPAKNAANIAIKKGIPTRIAFFNSKYAKEMRQNKMQGDLIIANNVLAHNPRLNDFVKGLKIALKKSGIITIELPHLLNLIKHNEFDTIYHEHYSYFSFYAVNKLFGNYWLKIFDVEKIPTHGGSLRIYIKHAQDKTKKISRNINQLLEEERAAGLYKLRTYCDFADRVHYVKRRLLGLLIKIKKTGKRIVGYGAPAKGNTLLNYCGIKNDFLDYTVDRNPFKQNKFLPGSRIAVMHPDRIRVDKPDYILILPWNIKKEIINQLSYVRKWQGRFIIPIPRPIILK